MLWMRQDTQEHTGCKQCTVHPSMQHVTGLHVTGLHVTGLHVTGLHVTGLHVMGLLVTGLHMMGLHVMGLLVEGHTHIVRGGPRADCTACPGRFGVLPIPWPSPNRPKLGPKPSFTDEPL